MIGTSGSRVAWTEENIETLKILRAAGMSAEEISKKIPFATRNSVIGKSHRLGLESKKKPPQPRLKSKAPIKRSNIVEARRLPPTPLPEVIRAPAGEGVPFMESNSKTCRAIVGRDKTGHQLALFCPNKKTEEQSFCAYHQDIYYRKDVR